jgi:hypothetical protein
VLSLFCVFRYQFPVGWTRQFHTLASWPGLNNIKFLLSYYYLLNVHSELIYLFIVFNTCAMDCFDPCVTARWCTPCYNIRSFCLQVFKFLAGDDIIGFQPALPSMYRVCEWGWYILSRCIMFYQMYCALLGTYHAWNVWGRTSFVNPTSQPV